MRLHGCIVLEEICTPSPFVRLCQPCEGTLVLTRWVRPFESLIAWSRTLITW
jgi:hypothetical protein